MEIWHIPESDLFLAGTDDFKNICNQYIKLEDAAIFFCRQGEAQIEIDLQAYALTANTQVVLLPGSIIHILRASDDFRISFICFTHRLFHEVTARLDPSFFYFLKQNPCVVLTADRSRSINRLAEAIDDLYGDRENCFRRQIARNFIQSFLFDIYDKTKRLFIQKRPEGISRQEELFHRFIESIHKHCTSRREVAFYAGELCITPRYLATVVQNVSGTTAKNIIDEHVLLEIKVLLNSTPLSIQEIANRLGFTNQSFFGRYFKKHTGLSPAEYRSAPHEDKQQARPPAAAPRRENE